MSLVFAEKKQYVNDVNVDHVTSEVKQDEQALRLVCPSLATVMILDDDHPGIFSLIERAVCLQETVGSYSAQIVRCGGSRGKVALSYYTEEGTATAGRDYVHCEGYLIFENGETELLFIILLY